MKKFEKYLIDNIQKIETTHPFYKKIIFDVLSNGGKRFRPMLLLEVVKIYEPMLYNNALAPATAVEYIHTYSLIHDDLPAMDNASLRRGYQTIHTQYDEAIAILIGDALNTESFNILAHCSLSDSVKIKLIKALSTASGIAGMVLGQSIDIYFEEKDMNIEDIKTMYINKTGKLIGVSLLMGAIISNLDEELQNKIYDLGIKLGVIFQIRDDILDKTSTSAKTGKDVSIDENKNNFVNLLGLEQSQIEIDKISKSLKYDVKIFNKEFQLFINNLLEKY